MEHETWLRALRAILHELVHGSAPDEGFVLNPGDPGLLRSLDTLSAEQASTIGPAGGASIAAHVDHLRYGLELLHRWSQGEHPFADADYAASWQRSVVSKEEWTERCQALTAAIRQWHDVLGTLRREVDETELKGVMASVVHLAYHLGAIRQIDRAMRGPGA